MKWFSGIALLAIIYVGAMASSACGGGGVGGSTTGSGSGGSASASTSITNSGSSGTGTGGTGTGGTGTGGAGATTSSSNGTGGMDPGLPCGSLSIPDGGGAIVSASSAVMPPGDACYEAWIRLDNTKQSPIILGDCTAADACDALLSLRDDQGLLLFSVQNGGAVLSASYAVNPHDEIWHHVAGCRAVSGTNTTLTLFWDGQLVSTVAGLTSQVGPPTDLRLGSLVYAATDGLGGLIDEVRVSDVLRYTQNFAPEVHLTNDAPTVLLLHFDAVVGTSFVDSSIHALSGTILGATTWSDQCYASAPCGSLSIPNGGGAIVSASSAIMPPGDACYEAWIRLDNTKQSPIILGDCTAADACDALLSVRDDQGLLLFSVQNGGALLSTSYAVNPHDDNWHHVAGCRAVSGTNTTLTLFWDGQLVSTVAGLTSQVGPPTDLQLGSLAYAATDGLGGLIDEVRVSNVLRYTQNFAPETHLTGDADAVLLLHFDSIVGTSFVDSSIHALSGTILGATTWSDQCQ